MWIRLYSRHCVFKRTTRSAMVSAGDFDRTSELEVSEVDFGSDTESDFECDFDISVSVTSSIESDFSDSG